MTETDDTPTQTDAEAARAILDDGRVGALSTISVAEPAGHPFGSVVLYALDDGGAPLMALSDLAEHATNLAADPRASLLVRDETTDDAMAVGRVTVVGDVERLEGDARAAARDRFLARHPDAFYVDFADFGLYRLAPAAIRYVGGFGRMSWVDPD